MRYTIVLFNKDPKMFHLISFSGLGGAGILERNGRTGGRTTRSLFKSQDYNHIWKEVMKDQIALKPLKFVRGKI